MNDAQDFHLQQLQCLAAEKPECKALQLQLYHWRAKLGDRIMVPNVCSPWEADFIGVTKHGYIHEYEIKISRSDFFADFKKDKHRELQGQNFEGLPNYFWFVVPKGLVKLEEVPPYCGLIELAPRWVKRSRSAPRLHKVQITDQHRMRLLQSMMYRYWGLRAKAIRR